MSSDIPSWSVEDVVALVTKLQVPHEMFRLHAVDGVVLQTLSEEELQAELGLTLLQARKIASHRPTDPRHLRLFSEFLLQLRLLY